MKGEEEKEEEEEDCFHWCSLILNSRQLMDETLLQSNGLHLQASRQVMRLYVTQGGRGGVLRQLWHQHTVDTGEIVSMMTQIN